MATSSIKAALLIFLTIIAALTGVSQNVSTPTIEVNGTATIYIVPNRITLEIGMEEYYAPTPSGDSIIVKISEIEKNTRKMLHSAGIPDSLIIISDIGNYRNRSTSSEFLMAKRLSATLTDFGQIETISDKLDRKGISEFSIAKIDNTEIERHNRRGLKAALDAAREKAEFIAENEGLKITMPSEIIETGPNYYETPTFSNVAFDSGNGMDNMRRIVRRYSVKVRYIFSRQ